MNKPKKCKNCQWYGKPYWSIINPCDNCPNENPISTTITIDQEKVFNEFVENVIDPIEKCQELQKEVDRLKEENEFLKLNNPEMNIRHFDMIKENKRKIDNLREQNKQLLLKNTQLKTQLKHYENEIMTLKQQVLMVNELKENNNG